MNGKWDEINNLCIGEYGHDSSSVVDQASSSTYCDGYYKTYAYYSREQLVALFVSNGHCRGSGQSFNNWPSESLRDHCIKHGGTGNYLWRYHPDPDWQGNTVGVPCEVDLGSDWGSSNECGAYVAPGVWKEFDCYNLAAIGKETGADPFTPSWRLIGGYWQWGRKGPDPSQWYDTNTPYFAHGPTDPDVENANGGSISGWDQNDELDGAWTDGFKTVNDPCPAGFRVPTRIQWEGVLDNNTQNTVGTWESDGTNYSSAQFFGDDLMLPTAGSRYAGSYWSSSEYDISKAWYLGFTDELLTYLSSGGNRQGGCSVRCVSDTSSLSLDKTTLSLNLGGSETVTISGGTGYYSVSSNKGWLAWVM